MGRPAGRAELGRAEVWVGPSAGRDWADGFGLSVGLGLGRGFGLRVGFPLGFFSPFLFLFTLSFQS